MMTAPEHESVNDPLEEMSRLAQKFLPLAKWGFKESIRFVSTSPKIIYDSEWCRVKFIWTGWEMYAGNELSIMYGRLHAPSDSSYMMWNDEKCYCWHSLMGTGAALDFLDGLTPQESTSRKGFSGIIEQLRQSELWQELAGKRRNPELAVRMEAAIWEHYGLRLFELFDLRRPDLWEGYISFLTECYRLKNWKPIDGDSSLPSYKRC
jgi:hypothetical protein